MGDFKKDHNGNRWFYVVGKGNKNRVITVSKELLNSFKRYRRSLGLSLPPSSDEQTPLTSKVKVMGLLEVLVKFV